MIDVNLWINVLTKPVETFKKYKETDMGKLFWDVVVASVIAGIVAALGTFLLILPYGMLFDITMYISIFRPIITVPIGAVVIWIVFSWLFDFIAKAAKRKSKFEEVAGKMAIIVQPLVIVRSVVLLIPLVGSWLRWLVVLFGLYLVALALNDYYNLGYNLGFGTGKKK